MRALLLAFALIACGAPEVPEPDECWPAITGVRRCVAGQLVECQPAPDVPRKNDAPGGHLVALGACQL